IDFDELWQVFCQAAYVRFSHDVGNDTAAQFHAWSNFSIDEVQWHLHVDLLSRTDTLEVDMLNRVANWVQLVITQQYGFFLAFQLQRQDGRVECFVTELQEQALVVELK